MSKIGESLLRGAQEALEYAKGNKKLSKTHRINIPEKIDVSAIREELDMSQDVFAANFGLKKRTVEKWEQSQRKPTDAARAYLTVIARDPQAVRAALSRSSASVHSRASTKRTHHKAKT
ncbi:MAG: helix-turn-helix domain-containing protein [Gammaproteobacteria bacterium]|nr:helix-turn-helix domain-containing protein [Gammaproteobacteria bacterium]